MLRDQACLHGQNMFTWTCVQSARFVQRKHVFPQVNNVQVTGTSLGKKNFVEDPIRNASENRMSRMK